MSIVNFCLTTDRIAVMTDTLLYRVTPDEKGPCGLTSGKASHNGVYACAARGPVDLCDRDQTLIERSAIPFDGMVRVMSQRVAPASPDDVYQLFLFGWSAELGRMAAVQFRWSGDLPEIVDYEKGSYMNPRPVGRQIALPAVVTDDQLFRLSLAHFKATTGQGVAYCVGGVAMLTQVDRDGARQSIAGLFPDYAEMSRRFKDPNAQAVAAWRGDWVAVA